MAEVNSCSQIFRVYGEDEAIELDCDQGPNHSGNHHCYLEGNDWSDVAEVWWNSAPTDLIQAMRAERERIELLSALERNRRDRERIVQQMRDQGLDPEMLP